MRALMIIPAVILLFAACDTVTEPGTQPSPAGTAIAWFNGLAGTVDLYYPGCDSLVTPAYTAGSAPNWLLSAGDDMLAVLNSLTPSLQVFDLSASGILLHEIAFPAGSNPWAMAQGYDNIWITLLMSHQIVTVSTEDWTLGGSIDVPDNPSGIVVTGGSIFVSHANYPVASSPGGVTVLNATTLEETGWIDTGVNTTELWLSEETGMIHALSTTYTDDGAVTVIDPTSAGIVSRIETGGAPVSPVRMGTSFACCDGFGERIFRYDESGSLIETWIPVASAVTGGITVSGDTLYMTDFGSDRVNRVLWQSQSLLDPVTSGDGPQGIVAVQRL